MFLQTAPCLQKKITHHIKLLLRAGPLVSGFDGHPVACSRCVQAGAELGWCAEV